MNPSTSELTDQICRLNKIHTKHFDHKNGQVITTNSTAKKKESNEVLVVPLLGCTGYTNRLVRVAAAVGLKVVAGMRAGLALAPAAVGQPKALAQCVSVCVAKEKTDRNGKVFLFFFFVLRRRLVRKEDADENKDKGK